MKSGSKDIYNVKKKIIFQINSVNLNFLFICESWKIKSIKFQQKYWAAQPFSTLIITNIYSIFQLYSEFLKVTQHFCVTNRLKYMLWFTHKSHLCVYIHLNFHLLHKATIRIRFKWTLVRFIADVNAIVPNRGN